MADRANHHHHEESSEDGNETEGDDDPLLNHRAVLKMPVPKIVEGMRRSESVPSSMSASSSASGLLGAFPSSSNNIHHHLSRPLSAMRLEDMEEDEEEEEERGGEDEGGTSRLNLTSTTSLFANLNTMESYVDAVGRDNNNGEYGSGEENTFPKVLISRESREVVEQEQGDSSRPTQSPTKPSSDSLLPSQQLLLSAATTSPLLPTETLQLHVPGVIHTHPSLAPNYQPVRGTLVVSSYKIEFVPDEGARNWRARGSYYTLPVGAVSGLKLTTGASGSFLVIHAKDMRAFRYQFPDARLAGKAENLLQTLAFPVSRGVGIRWIFAFTSAASVNAANASSEAILELDLLRNPDESRWRETSINAGYALIPSYPERFFVPKNIPDSILTAVIAFRSKGRIPMLVWSSNNTSRGGGGEDVAGCGTVWRCSQPRVGFAAAYSLEDEALVEAIRRLSGRGRNAAILDCRAYAAAVANRARGMGTEDEARYTNTKVSFENLPNVHSIRASHRQLRKLLQRAPQATSASGGGSSLGMATTTTSSSSSSSSAQPSNTDDSYLAQIEETGWLNHLRAILAAAAKISHLACVERLAVVVHCSDGWDRTSQVVSLAQVLADGRCRTRRGLRTLIFRDWILPGHRFRDRVGVGTDDWESSEEVAPIFLQYLDCLAQLHRQYPTWFEYSMELLHFLADALYSCRFGEFLGNTASEYETNARNSASLFAFLAKEDARFLNPSFDPATASARLGPNSHVLRRNVVLWDYYLHASCVPTHLDYAFCDDD